MSKQYLSSVMAAIHETAEGLYQALLMDRNLMRQFDAGCLTPVKPFSLEDVVALREREDVRQAVFAHHPGLSISLISQWQRGEKRSTGGLLKLLALVEKNGLESVA